MPVNVSGFVTKVNATFGVQLPKVTVQAQKEIAAKVVDNIGLIPWKLSGQWLGATNISIDQPDFTLPEVPFRTPTGADAMAKLEALQFGQSPVITLPEPYTRRLELYGWSPKAAPFSVLAAVKRASK